MQAQTLLQRTGCSEPVFKDWLKKKVILPARPGRGPGVHAEYDETNAVALLVGLKMKHAGITVVKYAPAFGELHNWLRTHSSLEWARQTVVMTPDAMVICSVSKTIQIDEMAVVASLASICSVLSQSTEDHIYQLPLLGLEVVRK